VAGRQTGRHCRRFSTPASLALDPGLAVRILDTLALLVGLIILYMASRLAPEKHTLRVAPAAADAFR